jgi:transposase
MMKLVRVGRKPVELAKEFGCHETSISAWVRQAQADERGGGRPDAPMITAERQEFAQLRRQLRQVTLERDIFAKATAWVAIKDGGIDKTSMHRSRRTRPTFPSKLFASTWQCPLGGITIGAPMRPANAASKTAS